jgi:serine phosphatase RsbU (regulator of sigma subunit)
MPRRYIVLLICFLSAIRGYSQNVQKGDPDSLWHVYNDVAAGDAARLGAMQVLCTMRMIDNPDSAIKLADKLFDLAGEKDNWKYLGQAEHDRGLIYKISGKYPLSVNSYFQCLQYWGPHNYDTGIAKCHQNMANVYVFMRQPEKAQMHFDSALAIFSKQHNEFQLGSVYNDLGSMHVAFGNDSLALYYLRMCLVYKEKQNDERGKALACNNMTDVFLRRHELDSAFQYMKVFSDYAWKINRTSYIIRSLDAYGDAYIQNGDPARGRDSCMKALRMNGELSSVELENDNCLCLYNAYVALKQPDSALKYYRRYIVARDSIGNQDQRTEILQVEYAHKELTDSLKTAAQMNLAAANLDSAKTRSYFLFAGLGLTLIFGGVMVNRFRIISKQKNQITVQQTETERQRRLIELKNTEITDSINYAKRIQNAILPSEQELKKSFDDIFVLFKPRDIVSGDFYWYDESDEFRLIALADCTGHGVPGGFMSMMGYELLQDVVMHSDVRTTSDAMRRLDYKLTQTLNKNDKTYRDGMDLAICAFPKNKMELHFSGAYRPLLHFSEGALTVYKADKHTIGGAIDNVKKDFTMHVIPLKQGDMIYLFTDGYADQFGGPNGKKFMSKKLEQLFSTINSLDCENQKMKLEQTFTEWKGALEQVDDVCVIGIRI